MTLRGLLEAGADDAPAIVTPGGSVLTHGELRAEVDRLVGRLQSLGLGPSHRVAIVVPNGADMAVAFLAAACAGCAAPLNPKYRAAELRFYLDDLGARALITRPDDSGAAARAAAHEADAEIVSVTLSGSAADGAGSLELHASSSVPAANAARDPSQAEMMRGSAGTPSPSEPGNDYVALVLHTSGTTSRPKIVPLRQRHLVRSGRRDRRVAGTHRH